MLADPVIVKAVLLDMNKLAIENKLSGLEKIKQILLLEHPMTIESDLLTPTMKIKRHVASKHFAQQLHDLYALPL
jgi:long-chain acyl-CoA synthetase